MGCGASVPEPVPKETASSTATEKAVPPSKPQSGGGLSQHGSEEAKAAFVRDEWLPFLHELREALVATRTRHLVGVSLMSVLPPQTQWETLTARCRELTAVWHGVANISVVYQLLAECSEYDGIAPYRFSEVPREWSADGWVRALDGRVRALPSTHLASLPN